MASGSEPISGFGGVSPQQGPGAEPLVGGLGDFVPQKPNTIYKTGTCLIPFRGIHLMKYGFVDFIDFCNFPKNSVRTQKTEINELSDHTEV